ncbi:hypothetical protein MNBD_GAMMA01-865 [hydrothermal vent metagenome]|uniref:Uncharacterized protein n=1 Tax=hydrothermal vent metagenome TaxID=652676 RepID=A0A3B0VAP6_9ZZZZ
MYISTSEVVRGTLRLLPITPQPITAQAAQMLIRRHICPKPLSKS